MLLTQNLLIFADSHKPFSSVLSPNPSVEIWHSTGRFVICSSEKTKLKFAMKFLFGAILLLGTVAATSAQKILFKVDEVAGSELEGRSFLRLITPSGKIYHFRDDATLGELSACGYRNLSLISNL